MRALSTLWHAPGRTWAGMMRAGSLALWAQIGAGVAGTIVLLGYGLVIWKGPWPVTEAGKQLDLLGQGQLIAGALVLIALGAIALLKLDFKVGREGVSASLERDDAPAVVTTTTTTVQPGEPSEPTRTS